MSCRRIQGSCTAGRALRAAGGAACCDCSGSTALATATRPSVPTSEPGRSVAARLLVDVGELELLDEADLPGDAVVTPFVYAVAGPSAAVAAAHARFMAHLEREYRAVELVEAPRAIAAAAEARLAGLAALTPE